MTHRTVQRFLHLGFRSLLPLALAHCAAGEEFDPDSVHVGPIKKTTTAGAGGSLAAGGGAGDFTSGGDPGAGGGSSGDPSSAGGQGGAAQGGASGSTLADSGASGGSMVDVVTYVVAPCPTCALSVQYSLQQANDPTQEIAFNLVIKNTASNIVHVNQISLRYWYTIDGEATQEFAIDYSKPQGGTVQFVKVMPPRPGADYYAEIKPSAAQDIAMGQTVEINMRIHKAGYQGTYKQNDDYSFGVGHSAFGDWPKITAYIAGTTAPVWGTEPQ